MMRPTSSLILVFLVTAGGVLLPGAAAGGCPKTLALEDFDGPGTQAVGVRTMTFVDSSRPTPANGEIPGAPERTLVTEIWYPALQVGRDEALDSAAGPYPVVIFSHGGGGVRVDGVIVGEHLASRGMIVAAPDYPLSNLFTPGGSTPADLPNQLADWSFVLDGVLAEYGVDADPQRVGATGHSLGGLTTLLVTFHPDLRDPRIQAALPMASLGCVLTGRFYRGVRTPLLVMHGDSDLVAPFREDGRRVYQRARRPRFFVRLKNGSHAGFSSFAALFNPAEHFDKVSCGFTSDEQQEEFHAEFLAALDALGGDEVGIRFGPRRCPTRCEAPFPDGPAMSAGRHHQLTRVVQAAFFEAYLLGDDAARCFLKRTVGQESDAKVKASGASRPAPLSPP